MIRKILEKVFGHWHKWAVVESTWPNPQGWLVYCDRHLPDGSRCKAGPGWVPGPGWMEKDPDEVERIAKQVLSGQWIYIPGPGQEIEVRDGD